MSCDPLAWDSLDPTHERRRAAGRPPAPAAALVDAALATADLEAAAARLYLGTCRHPAPAWRELPPVERGVWTQAATAALRELITAELTAAAARDVCNREGYEAAAAALELMLRRLRNGRRELTRSTAATRSTARRDCRPPGSPNGRTSPPPADPFEGL